jgi:hypothetical protein
MNKRRRFKAKRRQRGVRLFRDARSRIIARYRQRMRENSQQSSFCAYVRSSMEEQGQSYAS